LVSYSLTGTPVAGLILIRPGVQIKAVKGNALTADTNLSDERPHNRIESVPIHA
jgi:hypothetical protein